MELAYIVSAYRYPEQLVRLIRRLSTATTRFFIHVDKRTDDQVYRHMVNGVSDLRCVHFVRRHRCEWGGFGHVAATLEAISELVKWGIDYDYAILLTGQDYPIKSNRYIHQFFEEHRGQLFLEHFPLPNDEWQNSGMDRIEAWHWYIWGRHYIFSPDDRFPIKRKFPKDFRPYGGSSYWCLTRECVEYIHACTRRNPGLVRFFRYVDVPDELFFQTIICNSPFVRMAVNDNLRYIEWNDLDSGSPAILTSNDLDKLLSSSNLFARKFDVNVDAQVLDLIDQEINREDVVSV
jgi:hypothetical protein